MTIAASLALIGGCGRGEPAPEGCMVRFPCRVGAALCVEGGDCLVCVKSMTDPCPGFVNVHRADLCARP